MFRFWWFLMFVQWRDRKDFDWPQLNDLKIVKRLSVCAKRRWLKWRPKKKSNVSIWASQPIIRVLTSGSILFSRQTSHNLKSDAALTVHLVGQSLNIPPILSSLQLSSSMFSFISPRKGFRLGEYLMNITNPLTVSIVWDSSGQSFTVSFTLELRDLCNTMFQESF